MTLSRPLGFQVIAVPRATSRSQKPGLMRRLFDTLFGAREKRAQRAVDEFIAQSGGRLTDSIEREIGERMLGGRGTFHR